DLDALGNWSGFATDANGDGDYTDAADLDQSRDANAANEITDVIEGQGQTAWATPVYDDAGNMITGPGGKAAELSTSVNYVYDAWNRLVKAYRDTGEWYQQWEQRLYYDGQGQLIATDSVDYGVGIYHRMDYYLNAAAQVVEARWAVAEDFGEVAELARYQYVWGLDAATPVLRDADTQYPPNQDGNCTDETSERLYYTHDANDNVTALVKTDGPVAARYGYETRGAPIFYNASWAVQSNDLKNSEYLFASYRYLTQAGLYHAGARDLHPYVGTWMQKDPIGLADGMNPRTYCRNNPMNGRDPSGMAFMSAEEARRAAEQQSYIAGPWAITVGSSWSHTEVSLAATTELAPVPATDWDLLLNVPKQRNEAIVIDVFELLSPPTFDRAAFDYERDKPLKDSKDARMAYCRRLHEYYAAYRSEQDAWPKWRAYLEREMTPLRLRVEYYRSITSKWVQLGPPRKVQDLFQPENWWLNESEAWNNFYWTAAKSAASVACSAADIPTGSTDLLLAAAKAPTPVGIAVSVAEGGWATLNALDKAETASSYCSMADREGPYVYVSYYWWYYASPPVEVQRAYDMLDYYQPLLQEKIDELKYWERRQDLLFPAIREIRSLYSEYWVVECPAAIYMDWPTEGTK
ncbi:MAG: RHS repeat-associated core domain-containing protein, partial [Phycisphaerae bacterium]